MKRIWILFIVYTFFSKGDVIKTLYFLNPTSLQHSSKRCGLVKIIFRFITIRSKVGFEACFIRLHRIKYSVAKPKNDLLYRARKIQSFLWNLYLLKFVIRCGFASGFRRHKSVHCSRHIFRSCRQFIVLRVLYFESIVFWKTLLTFQNLGCRMFCLEAQWKLDCRGKNAKLIWPLLCVDLQRLFWEYTPSFVLR